MNYKNLTLAIAATLSLTLLSAVAEDKDKPAMDASKLPPAATTPGLTFEKDIKPIFDNSCTKCHKGEKARHKLQLDSLEGTLKGGKDGKDVIVGKSGESPLVYDVAHVGDEDDFMPPTKKNKDGSTNTPLTAAQVGIIRAWIDQGAK